MARLLALALACASTLLAEEGTPEGFVKIDTIGRIHVFAQSEDTLDNKARSQILVGVKGIYDVYTRKYCLDREVWRIGVDGGWYVDTKRDTVGLYIFTDAASYRAWVGNESQAAHTRGLARYVSAVCVSLEDGTLSPGTWGNLWHEFSHVFYWHYLWLGEPMWLNEGLAEYFKFSEKHGKAKVADAFAEMIESLAEGRHGGSATPISKLLATGQEGFGRQQYNEAWVLVHMLMTEKPDLVDGLMGAIAEMDAAAWITSEAHLKAANKDVQNYAASLLTTAFDGAAKLQEAWDAHLAALIENPQNPKRLQLRVKTVKPGALCAITARMSGSRDGYRRPIGNVVYQGPRGATLRVLAAVGDGKGAWSTEWIVGEETHVEPGQRIEFKELWIPDYKGERVGRVTADFLLDDGGNYRVRKVWEFK